MPKIKSSSKKDVISVFESKNPLLNTIYLEGEGYDKSTLAPIFDSGMYMTPAADKTSYRGQNIHRFGNNGNTTYRAGSPGGTLVLPKSYAVSIQTVATGDNYLTNIDVTHMLSMDPENESNSLQRIVDGQNHLEILFETYVHYNRLAVIAWNNNNSERYITLPSVQSSYGGTNTTSSIKRPLWASIKDPNSNWISVICSHYEIPSPHIRPASSLARANFNNISEATWALGTTVGFRNIYTIQYIGKSNTTGQPLYQYQHVDTDYTHFITRHNIDANTTTDLNSFNAIPSAAGTNAGGARIFTSFGRQCKFSSKTFSDPTSPGNLCWYSPYFDTNLNYHPFFYQWNKTTDTFTRSSDITIVGSLSSTNLNNLTGLIVTPTQSGFSAIIYNETFVSGGNRYLTVIPMNGGYQAYDANPLGRNIITYQIDATDPKILTHHSVATVPNTIRQIVWLSDDRTLLGVFCVDAFHIYKWNNTTGWDLTSTITNRFVAVGRDSLDRIWAVAANGDEQYCDIHLLTPTIPLRISITPASNVYNYTGTTINSTVGVSAYNIENERISVPVELTINGSTMTFGGSTNTTITTSTTSDVNVNISIISSGLSDIVASVVI
jgi:hypothetical protein